MVLHGLCDAWRTGSPAPGLRALGVFLPAQRVFLLLLLLPVTPLMALFLAPFVAVSAEADIHRCRSSEGEVSYTDLHCPDGVLILEADASTPASRSTATGGLSKQEKKLLETLDNRLRRERLRKQKLRQNRQGVQRKQYLISRRESVRTCTLARQVLERISATRRRGYALKDARALDEKQAKNEALVNANC